MTMTMRWFFLLAFTTFWQTPAHAYQYFCDPALESMPTQQGGRVKPVYVAATEDLKYLTGESKLPGNLTAMETYCLLSLSYAGVPLPAEVTGLSTRIEHVQTRELLGVTATSPHMPLAKLAESFDTIRSAMMQQKEDNSYKKDLVKLMGKIRLYQDITSGSSWTFPVVTGKQVEWLALNQYLSEDRMSALGSITQGETAFSELFQKAKADYIATASDSYLLELTYAKMHLPSWSLLVTLVALAALVLLKQSWPGLALTAVTLVLQIALITLRVLISQRAPITNMYETVLFSGSGALLLATILAVAQKEKRYVFVGLCYNVCTLMMLNFANGMLSAQIGPLVPVLRDNFWLSTHVTTVILSYGALALSWIMANTVLVKKRLQKLTKADQAYYSNLIYNCLQVGTTLLAAGIILGGVWADYSWGRFWGWDPKETWSLIVLCVYMAILHGRSTSWIPGHRFVTLVAGAFMSVMMAWFGVNYILATGLHSYGFSEGGALFLATFFLIQIVVLVVTANAFKKDESTHAI